jgi:hypothetical protein
LIHSYKHFEHTLVCCPTDTGHSSKHRNVAFPRCRLLRNDGLHKPAYGAESCLACYSRDDAKAIFPWCRRSVDVARRFQSKRCLIAQNT